MSEHLIITLRVLDRVYCLKVKRKDEHIYRKAAKNIEKKTSQYRKYFKGAESDELLEQDYLAMASIQALSETVELENENELFESKVKSLISELDIYLTASR